MRTITAGLFSAADGVVAEPQDWHFPYFCDELGAAVGELVGGADTLLFGRTTYEGFAEAWPAREAAGQDLEFAKALGDARKIVFSHEQLDFTWRNSEQVRGDLLDFVRELKAGDGGPVRCPALSRWCASCCVPDSWTSCTCSSTRSPSAAACGCGRTTSTSRSSCG